MTISAGTDSRLVKISLCVDLRVKWSKWFYLLAALCSLSMLAASPVGAHTLRPAVATLQLDESGLLSVQIRTNAEALLAGIGPEHGDTDDAPTAALYNELRALPGEALATKFADFAPEFLNNLELKSSTGVIVVDFISIDVPETGDLELARDSLINLQTRLPATTESVVWAWPPEYGSSVVRFSTPESVTPVTAWLRAGQVSDALAVSGVMSPPSRLTVVIDYIVLGFEHILPLGLDHILFVLGLFLLSVRLAPLLWQISAFTLAHTLTLGLSIYGVISLPASIVEPLIAISIAYVGIENCLYSQLKPWRVLLVFLFGLLHGMGFAGVLSEIGLPEGEYLTALLSFNVGVEFGQLAVVSLAFLCVGWFRHKDWYRRAIVVPASLAIAAAGLYWTWERIFT